MFRCRSGDRLRSVVYFCDAGDKTLVKRHIFWGALFVLLPQSGYGQSPGNIITLDFEGLKNQEAVLSYYNGGSGSLGSGPGPNYGVTFLADSQVLTSNPGVPGFGNFINEPSPNNAIFFGAGSGDIMNVAGGFTGGFSFFYTGPKDGSVTVWSGPNGTGTLLASLFLPKIAANPVTQINDMWAPIGVEFNGVAGSVNFSGTANNIAYDNITLGSKTPTLSLAPAPSSLTVVLVAAVIGGAGWRRRSSRRPR